MGFFDFITNPINDAWDAAVDSNPITSGISNAVHTVGENTGINDVVDKVAPYVAAAAAIYLSGGTLAPEAMDALAGEAAAQGMTASEYATLVADSAPIDSAMAGAEGAGGALGAEGAGGAVGANVAGSGAVGGADLAGTSAVGGSGASLGSGTAYAEGATTNPLSPFYGTAQASPTSLGLVSGGGGSTIGEGSIIGSGAGLGQTVPASVFNVTNALNMAKIPSTSSTPQKQMANALRLPTDLNTNVAVYKQENPFYYSPQQQLANMLKV